MTQVDEVSSAPYEMPYVLVEAPVEAEVTWQTYEITAYTAGPESTGKHPGDKGYGITTSGDHVREGVTAACPPSMAFGTRLEIEGVGERVCADRGGAIGEGRLDIYIAELKDAQAFGRQWLNVRVIE